ncbi:MAG: hypothetical protein ABIN24_07720 [Dyadobacter sp.]
METGFNIVEVPGSKSRKVARTKQQWYRTAILKMFLPDINPLYFSSFPKKVTVSYNVLDSNLFTYSVVQAGTGNNLIFSTDFKTESGFSIKLQKIIRFLFRSNVVLLVKSYFSSLFKVLKIDLSHLATLTYSGAINLKNR